MPGTTPDAATIELLTGLETAMWAPATRFDRDWLDRHLAPEFTEFGRSGLVYARDDVLADHEMRPIGIRMPLVDLRVRFIGADVAVVTYRTDESRGWTNRASIWRRTAGEPGWQLEFHQGTPDGDAS